MNLLLHNANLIVPDGAIHAGWVLVQQGRITGLGYGTPPDAAADIPRLDGHAGAGWTVVPGFIDIHVHGAVGFDTMDATPEALAAMSRFFASRGVTGFLATTVTAPGDATLRALQNTVVCMKAEMPGAAVLGAHLEGPYINVEAKGAQEGKYVRPADPAEYQPWLDLGVIRLTTVAPEFAPNRQFIADCVAHGVTVSLGHTQATYEQALEAVALGARHATHTFNAMTGVHHRKPGVVGAALTEKRITCELIADTIHVHPAVMNLIALAKEQGGVALITDAIQGAGMPDGVYDLGGQPVYVKGDRATLEDGTLAGSILTYDQGLRNMIAATGWPLERIWRMTSFVPARQIGLGHSKGALRTGHDADLTVLGADLRVQHTIVGGSVVYTNEG